MLYTLNIYNSYLSIISQEEGFLWLLHGGGSQRTGHGRTPTVWREQAGAVAGARDPDLGGETLVRFRAPCTGSGMSAKREAQTRGYLTLKLITYPHLHVLSIGTLLLT